MTASPRPSSAFDDSEFDDPRFDDPRYDPTAGGLPPTSEDRLLALAAHLSALVGAPLLVPLVIYLVKKDDGGFAADHAREALNFHITVLTAFAVSAVLVVVLIGIPLLVLVSVGAIVLTIVAAVRAGGGQPYRYPFTLRLV